MSVFFTLSFVVQVVASVNMADESKRPKVTAESTWNFEV